MNIVDYISPGKENAVTRVELALRTGLPDRKVRKLIEEARKDGAPILNDQDGVGYYLSEEPGELKRQYRTNRSRALSILRQNTRLRRRIEELEEGGNQCRIEF